MPHSHHIHSSGRFDRPAHAIAAGLDSYAERGVDVLTLTEHNNTRHRRVTATWAEAWGYAVAQGAGAAANCAIAVNTATHRIVEMWTEQLTEYEQRRGPGGPPPPECITALVEHIETGERMLWSVAHLPSNVEDAWRDRGRFDGRAWRVFVYLQAHRAWARHLRRLRREHRCKVAMVADWNLNFELRRFRGLVKAWHPNLRLTWRRFRGRGTHHRRFIDATLTNAEIVEAADLLPDDDSSDHRPYEEVLAY